jgi:hypothetical protein
MRGKYKRKKQRQEAQQHSRTAAIPTGENQEPAAKKQSESKRNNDSGSKEPSMKTFFYLIANDPRFLLEFIVVLAGIAVAIIYGLQLQAMRQTMRIDQRPWIKVTANFDPIEPLKPVVVKGQFIDNGKTPAKAVESHLVVEKIANGTFPQFGYPEPHLRFRNSLLFPGDPHEFTVTYPVDENSVLSQKEFDDFNANKFFFVFYTRVEYTDFFNVKHWTQVCVFQGPKTGGVITSYPCTAYRDVDSN